MEMARFFIRIKELTKSLRVERTTHGSQKCLDFQDDNTKEKGGRKVTPFDRSEVRMILFLRSVFLGVDETVFPPFLNYHQQITEDHQCRNCNENKIISEETHFLCILKNHEPLPF